MKNILFIAMACLPLFNFPCDNSVHQKVAKLPQELQLKIYALATHMKLFPENAWVEHLRLKHLEERKPQYGGNWAINSIAVFPDETKVIAGASDGSVVIWDVLEGIELNRMLHIEKSRGVHSVAVFPDGNKVVSGDYDGSIVIWDALTGEELKSMQHGVPTTNQQNGTYACTMALFPDGSKLFSGAVDNSLVIWDTSTGTKLNQMTHGSTVSQVAVFPHGYRVASAGSDNKIKIWNAENGQKIFEYNAERFLAVFPNGNKFISSSKSYSATVDEINGKALTLDHGYHSDFNAFVSCAAVFPDGKRIITGTFDNKMYKYRGVWLWDARAKLLDRLYHPDNVESLAVFKSGKKIASGSGDQTLRILLESKPCVEDYFNRSLNSEAHYLFWLLLEYKDFLQEEYPEKKAICIEDVVAFAKKLQPNKNTTVETLTTIRNSMPRDVQNALVKGLRIYSLPDDKVKLTLRAIRAKKDKNK